MSPTVDLAPLPRLYQEHVAALSVRYAAVMKAHGLDALVLHAGSPQKKSAFDDQYWPLVGVPHTKHWLPLAVVDSAVVIEPGKKPRVLVNVARDFWEGPPEQEGDHYWAALERVEVKGAEGVRACLPHAAIGAGRAAFVGEDRSRAASWGFVDDRVAPAALMTDLDQLRTIKSDYEILCMREANRRAALGHAALLRAFVEAPGSDVPSELELHLRYLEITRQDEPETPYKNIVAEDAHAATLHHVQYGKSRVPAGSLLVDAGACCFGIESDITRTVGRGTGAAADAFRALVAGLDRLQRELCARVKPGLPYQALHNQSHELLAELLRELGIAKASTAALVDSGATRKLLPHGLGHSLGIQTHDVGCRKVAPEARNPFLRNTTTITPGQCFTIEPGCYFIPALLDELRALPVAAELDWRLIDALTPFGGVRIEDDLFVTATGHENLTRPFLA
ncbi:MAG: Xaa-Pro dipeptidase [Deltaproteobacteria bacterium]|nr:Xaa-Pro dipeptidase [Deltaproteobacteria bacterium]